MSLSYLIMLIFTAVGFSMFADSSGALGFFVLLELLFITYWLCSYFIVDDLSRTRYPPIESNMVKPEVDLERGPVGDPESSEIEMRGRIEKDLLMNEA